MKVKDVGSQSAALEAARRAQEAAKQAAEAARQAAAAKPQITVDRFKAVAVPVSPAPGSAGPAAAPPPASTRAAGANLSRPPPGYDIPMGEWRAMSAADRQACWSEAAPAQSTPPPAPSGNPYDAGSEFGHVLHAVFDRLGGPAAEAVQKAVVDALAQGQQPAVGRGVPQPGDVMVWGPNAGSYASVTGQADGAGHAGIVEKVTDHGDGTVTVRVSEQNWAGKTGEQDGVPYRDIKLRKRADGTLVLPEGVGFVSPSKLAPPAEPTGPTTPTTPTTPAPGYDAKDEFGYALQSVADRFGAEAAKQLEAVVAQIKGGGAPAVSRAVPRPGDVMVYGPNCGGGGVGRADGAGHVGVVERVTENRDGTVTIRVSEQNWGNKTGEANGVPYRDLTLRRNADGSLSLPAGVGFTSQNPEPPPAVTTPTTPPPAGGPQNPPIGKHKTAIDDPSFQIYDTPAHDPNDPYMQCLGYVHDIPQYAGLIEGWTADNGGSMNGGDCPINSKTPKEGDLIVWRPNSGDRTVGTTGEWGHVGYVEQVTANYEPVGDPSGKLVSYTVTISEANANGKGNDDRTLKTFTVAADASGEAKLPEGVGFYDPAPGAGPVTGGSIGSELQRGADYRIRSGDLLGSIAYRAGISLDELLRANPQITNPDAISVGQVIHIP